MQNEKQARRDLAACYRLFDWLGWSELIFNHITLRRETAPGEKPEYLINPFGLHYAEVTPANLVCIDIDGNPRDAGGGAVNRAGFVIHSAVHAARADAHCIMHVHTTAGCAVACKQEGLRHDNFYSAMLYGDLAYHDYEGVTTNLDEQPRLVASLGACNHLILRNHGLLVVGPDIPTTFNRLWVLQRACEIQLASDAGLGENRVIPEAILRTVPQTRVAGKSDVHRTIFETMLRRAGIATADGCQRYLTRCSAPSPCSSRPTASRDCPRPYWNMRSRATYCRRSVCGSSSRWNTKWPSCRAQAGD